MTSYDQQFTLTASQLQQLIQTNGVAIDTLHCPACGSLRLWSEVGPGDRADNISIRLHCDGCGWQMKQDVEPNQIVIPKALLEQLKIGPGTKLRVMKMTSKRVTFTVVAETAGNHGLEPLDP